MDNFLELSSTDRASILNTVAPKLSRTAESLEKDIYVCWCLEYLFNCPERKKMSFKGGTSLSKAYGLIDRFSEDVDITVDYSEFQLKNDPYSVALSKSQLDTAGKSLRKMLREYLVSTVEPYLNERLSTINDDAKAAIYVDVDDKADLGLTYARAAEAGTGYVGDKVLIEFGALSPTGPSSEILIRADIEDYYENLSFPKVQATVMSPSRTFWEKVTLAHYECRRPALKDKPNINRISRHWYDLSKMMTNGGYQEYLDDRATLELVIKYKSLFYNSSYAAYEKCNSGQLEIVPQGELHEHLQKDYAEMVASGMFYNSPPSFDKIIGDVGDIQYQINEMFSDS